jgi:hypothetical protein
LRFWHSQTLRRLHLWVWQSAVFMNKGCEIRILLWNVCKWSRFSSKIKV